MVASSANLPASSGNKQAANTVGGARTGTLARRPQKGGSTDVAKAPTKRANDSGLLKFYSEEAPGLKIGPTTVLVFSLAFMLAVVSLHIMGKFRAGAA